MSYKLVLVRAEKDYCECMDGCSCEPRVTFEEVSLADLLQRAKKEWELQLSLNSLLQTILAKPDYMQLAVLKAAGWVNTKDVENQEKTLVEGNYVYLDTKYGRVGQRVDPSHLTESAVLCLARDDVQIARLISKSSLKKLMDKDTLAVYNRELSCVKKSREQARATAEKRRERKKQKELEKARRVLEAAGELPHD